MAGLLEPRGFLIRSRPQLKSSCDLFFLGPSRLAFGCCRILNINTWRQCLAALPERRARSIEEMAMT